jgi:hypothetical protein
MPATYEKIATTTLGSSATDVTFTSISGSYTDIVLISSAKVTAGENGSQFTFNGDTASNYSTNFVYGIGSTGSSVRSSGGSMNVGRFDSTAFYTNVTHLMNYSSTTTYKTVISRINDNTLTGVNIGIWRSTSAVTSLKLDVAFMGSFVAGSTFTLYGILKAA